MKKNLITGATGNVGIEVVAALLKNATAYRNICRSKRYNFGQHETLRFQY
jgi:nucleoside-diphosphate-sugar epimerase